MSKLRQGPTIHLDKKLFNKVYYQFIGDDTRLQIYYGGAACLKSNTKVVMFSGELKEIGQIIVGDKLMGIDSTPRIVLNVHKGTEQLYKIKQSHGLDYITNGNHLLSLRKSDNAGRPYGNLTKAGTLRHPNGRYSSYNKYINMSINEFINKSDRFKRNFLGYRTDVKFDFKDVKINPYFLGAWLGDGTSTNQNITSIDNEIFNFLKEYAFELNMELSQCGKKGTEAKTYRIIKIKGKSNKLLNWLREYNLISNKHIPDVYLYNSREVRLQVLAGLLDTDGYKSRSCCYEITQKNKLLINQIVYLCNSLGFRAQVKETKKSIKSIGFIGTYYRVHISGNKLNEIPVKIERKKLINFKPKKNLDTTLLKVEVDEIGEYTGIEVDKDHLFLLEDFTVTHNSGKSYALAQKCVYDLLKGGRNYLVVRNVSSTLRTSTFPEIRKVISHWGLSKYFKINLSEMKITNIINNYQIMFKGLDDVEKIKSITTQKGSLTNIWIEEATEVSQEAYKQLKKRLRGQSPVKKCILISFNPILRSHWIYKEFFGEWYLNENNFYRDKEKFIIKTTYKDNCFLEADDIAELENENDPYWYNVYTLGNWGVLGDTIFRNWTIKEISRSEINQFDNIKNGLDWGFSNDPTAFIRTHYDKKNKIIYIFKELYEKKLTNENIVKLIEPIIGKEYIICDSAEPKSIKELQNLGINALAAKKGKDSILHGIQWLQGHQIIVDSTCQSMINEFQLYTWKTDKNGVSMSIPVDKNNHLCLVGDTQVMTLTGNKNIKDIKPGEYVYTREGFFEVLKSERTGIVDKVFTKFNVSGTEDHPIYVKNKGFTALKNINEDEDIPCLIDLKKVVVKANEKLQELSYLKTKNTIDTQNHQDELTGYIIEEEKNTFIEKFIKSIKVLFQKECIYTTRTITRLIIKLKILKLKMQLNIYQTIQKPFIKIMKKRLKTIWKKLGRLLKNGTLQKKVLSGINNMEKKYLEIEKWLSLFVINVVKNLNLSKYGVNFVQVSAKQNLDDYQELIISKEFVSIVKKNSSLINTQSKCAVQEAAQEKIEVFNLLVNSQHEFFANGVLVSNCDALRYAYSLDMNWATVKMKKLKGI